MTDYYPLSIVVHGIALNITVQSHVDKLCFGLIACRRAVPDVHELGKHLQRAMALLRAGRSAPPLAAPAKRRGRERAGRAGVAAARQAAPRGRQGGRRRARRASRACASSRPARRASAGRASRAASAKAAQGRQAAQGAARVAAPRVEGAP